MARDSTDRNGFAPQIFVSEAVSQSGTLAPPDAAVVAADVERALAEDVGAGDATAALVPRGMASARIASKDSETCVLAGSAWAQACFLALDPDAHIIWTRADGASFVAGDTLCTIRGDARALLTAERSALNFLQTLSGTATTVARYVAAIQGTTCRILDTRKTLPGLRYAQKYAVRAGGGTNHRMGLYDAILIKENHVAAAGGIAQAVAAARALSPGLPVEVEVENMDELREAIAATVERVMLDEFQPEDRERAVSIAAGRVEIEVSGNVTLETVGDIAASGVDFISIGALTKHLRAVDLSLRVSGA